MFDGAVNYAKPNIDISEFAYAMGFTSGCGYNRNDKNQNGRFWKCADQLLTFCCLPRFVDYKEIVLRLVGPPGEKTKLSTPSPVSIFIRKCCTFCLLVSLVIINFTTVNIDGIYPV